MSAQECAFGTVRVSPLATAKARTNEPLLEIGSDALTEPAIRGLVEAWVLPQIVDRIIESVMARERVHDISEVFMSTITPEAITNGKEPEGRSAAETNTT
jgi:hypothetical protein